MKEVDFKIKDDLLIIDFNCSWSPNKIYSKINRNDIIKIKLLPYYDSKGKIDDMTIIVYHNKGLSDSITYFEGDIEKKAKDFYKKLKDWIK